MTKRLTKHDRRVIKEAQARAARKNLLDPHGLQDRDWAKAFGESTFDLTDGKARVFALNRFGILSVYAHARLDEEWLAPLIKGEIDTLKAMTILERRLKAKSPWRPTYFVKVQVAIPRRDKESGQYFVEFFIPKAKIAAEPESHKVDRILKRVLNGTYNEEDRKPLVTRYYFHPEVVKAIDLEGWLTPRKQAAGRPWRISDEYLRAIKPKRMWVPDLTDDEVAKLAADPEENKCWVIRELHKRHRAELNVGLLDAVTIKEAVEHLIERALNLK